MRIKRRWVALLMVFGLVAAACGGGGGTAEESSTTQATTATTAGQTTTTKAGAPSTEAPMEIKTDVGVDLDAGVIKIGLLSDLTGPFGPLVSLIVAGHEVFWQNVNDNGGINGLKVELEVRDTQYVVDNHVQFYEELKDQVVAFGHSTGSPHTVAIVPQLEEDGILAIPLTWYSGWTDPDLNSNLLHHGTPYCLESQNMIQYLVDQAKANGVDNPKLAIASLPGDYGLDSAAGAKIAAETLGLEVVYDGSGTIIPTDESTLTANADAIVASGADIVWITATPGSFAPIYGQAIAKGFQALWSGAAPTFNPAFVAPDSAIKDAIARDWYQSGYYTNWFDDSPGASEARDLFAKYRPDAPPQDFYLEGFVEGMIMKAALEKAYENGDMTQAGVLAAAKSIENLDLNGIGPAERYTGSANEQLQRAIYISRPDPEGLAAGTSTGLKLIEKLYTSDIAKNYVFEHACYKLGS